MQGMVEEIKKFEHIFSDNNYNGSGRKSIVIERGFIPIMISAPHAVNQFRKGKVKWADMYTGGIAKYVHEKTGCHLIYSSKYTESDPNFDYPEINNYQQMLKKYLTANKVFLLMDLHGASKSREYAIEMGTAPRRSTQKGEIYEEDSSLHKYKFIDDIIKNVFEKRFRNLKVERKEIWKNIIFDAGHQNTITKYISENTNTASIQLEINGIYRNPDNYEEFYELVGGLIESVNKLAKLKWE